jgi:hypothetical protein
VSKRDCRSPYHELEKQTEEFKYSIDAFGKDMKCYFEEDDELGLEASKPNPEDWSECMDFQKEIDMFLKRTRILLATYSRDGDGL